MPIGLLRSLPGAPVAPPDIVVESGSGDRVPSVVPGVAALREALDHWRIPHTAIAYPGGHTGRQRQRISEHLLPAVGRWFRSLRITE
jgi:hypothetical protein